MSLKKKNVFFFQVFCVIKTFLIEERNAPSI